MKNKLSIIFTFFFYGMVVLFMGYGTHTFEGRTGRERKDYNYRANVYESKKSTNDYIVTFEKESKKIFTGRSYTESRTKTIHYEK